MLEGIKWNDLSQGRARWGGDCFECCVAISGSINKVNFFSGRTVLRELVSKLVY